jgi:hypothetical protein
MNHAISVELQFFLISVLWGSILLLIYDLFRIFRRLVKHDTFFVALEDLIFWVAASLFIFAMMYRRTMELSVASPLWEWQLAWYFIITY